MQELTRKVLRAFSGVPAVDPWSPKTAVVLIDMQVSCIREHGYTIRRLRQCGLEEAVAQYQRQLRAAIPNLQRVLARAREGGQVIVHARVETVKSAESSWHVQVTRWAPPGSDESQIIEELAPRAGEIDMPKTCSGVFTGTNLSFLLHRLDITSMIVGGVVTHGCVERCVMEGHDLGFAAVLLSDGTASTTDELHENALERMIDRRAHVLTTEALMATTHLPPTLQARREDAATQLA
jgi:nicotinamidase-related amidase